jgi:hypothetical protein
MKDCVVNPHVVIDEDGITIWLPPSGSEKDAEKDGDSAKSQITEILQGHHELVIRRSVVSLENEQCSTRRFQARLDIILKPDCSDADELADKITAYYGIEKWQH